MPLRPNKILNVYAVYKSLNYSAHGKLKLKGSVRGMPQPSVLGKKRLDSKKLNARLKGLNSNAEKES